MLRFSAGAPRAPQRERESRRRRGVMPRRGLRPDLEGLETRLTPSTATWTGAGSDRKWRRDATGAGAPAPHPGDALLFPANATSLNAVNNFTPGTSFHSLTIAGLGYTLSEASGDSISLTAGISATYTSGTSTD